MKSNVEKLNEFIANGTIHVTPGTNWVGMTEEERAGVILKSLEELSNRLDSGDLVEEELD